MRSYFIVLLIVLFSACSHIPQRKALTLSQWRQLIRLDGEGKSRLEFGEKQYVLSFWSQFKNNSWMMGFSAPFQEEIVWDISLKNDAQTVLWLQHVFKDFKVSPDIDPKFVSQHFYYYLNWLKMNERELVKSCQNLDMDSWACNLSSNKSFKVSVKDGENLEFLFLDGQQKTVITLRMLEGEYFHRHTVDFFRSVIETRQPQMRLELIFR